MEDIETLVEVQPHRDTQHQHPIKPKARLTVYTCMEEGERAKDRESARARERWCVGDGGGVRERTCFWQ